MSEELVGEDCDNCGAALIRISEDDISNAFNCAIVTCPSCPRIVRRLR